MAHDANGLGDKPPLGLTLKLQGEADLNACTNCVSSAQMQIYIYSNGIDVSGDWLSLRITTKGKVELYFQWSHLTYDTI